MPDWPVAPTAAETSAAWAEATWTEESAARTASGSSFFIETSFSKVA